MTAMERDGLVYGMPEAEYHGAPGELSSTGAKLLLQAPAKFKHQVVDGNRVHKDAYDVGTAVHTKVLGAGILPVTCPEELLASNGAMSTAGARAWKAEQQAAGVPVVSVAELKMIDAMAESVLAVPTARALLEAPGNPEVSAFATCPETGVRLRARFDRLPSELAVAVDLKTTAGSAHETEFAKTIFNFGYDVQGGQYEDTLRYATGRQVEFVFIVVETSAPYLVNVIAMPHTYMEMGRAKSMEARRRYAHGMATGEWPGYSDQIKRPDPPMFAVYDFQDNYEGTV